MLNLKVILGRVSGCLIGQITAVGSCLVFGRCGCCCCCCYWPLMDMIFMAKLGQQLWLYTMTLKIPETWVEVLTFSGEYHVLSVIIFRRVQEMVLLFLTNLDIRWTNKFWLWIIFFLEPLNGEMLSVRRHAPQLLVCWVLREPHFVAMISINRGRAAHRMEAWQLDVGNRQIDSGVPWEDTENRFEGWEISYTCALNGIYIYYVYIIYYIYIYYIYIYYIHILDILYIYILYYIYYIYIYYIYILYIYIIYIYVYIHIINGSILSWWDTLIFIFLLSMVTCTKQLYFSGI